MQIDFYEEEDVDELDSDSDVDDDQDASSAKKGSSKKDGKRIPGQSLLPATRLESIIQADGTGDLAKITIKDQLTPSSDQASLATWPCRKRLLTSSPSRPCVPHWFTAVSEATSLT
jgi:hypothetical protein